MRSLMLFGFFLLLSSGEVSAAILVQSPSGTYTSKASLAVAATETDCAGKIIYMTTSETLTGNLTWPADRDLVPLNGAKIDHGSHSFCYLASTARWPVARVITGMGKVTFSPQTVVSPQWFGAVADDSTNNTAAFQKTVDSSSRVYVPPGVYRIGLVKLKSNLEFYGAGNSTILRRYQGVDPRGKAFKTYRQEIVLLATNYGSDGTPNVADNKTNIYVHDLQLDGRSRDFASPASSYHNMVISATSNMVVERVHFYDFVGDGAYLASGTTAGVERHNVNIKFSDCIFDGAGNDNRNGISIIDCDGISIERCLFKRIGNAMLSQSVGAVDFEPNNDWNINRLARIVNCTFEDLTSTNTAAITVFNGRQTGDNLHDWLVDRCTFTRCYVGFGGSAKRKGPRSANDNITISNCTFTNSITFDIINLGFKGVTVTGNTFRLDPIGSHSYRGGIKLGQLSGGVNGAAFDTIVSNNRFIGLRPQFGMLALYGVNGLSVINNTFEDITGIIIKVLSPAEAGEDRSLKGISIKGNTVNNKFRKTGAVTTSSFIGYTGGARARSGNSFITSFCSGFDNVVNDGVPCYL